VTIIARLTRATMLETLGQDYIRTARAKGVVERAVVLRHGLKNALIPSSPWSASRPATSWAAPC